MYPLTIGFRDIYSGKNLVEDLKKGNEKGGKEENKKKSDKIPL